ncbi:CheR family methyltransferase [Aridibaculum aurantiacum]|uniref:CheR family methyltransferase n=1 Tax=Aridibaculum aurantiacum TaxID=2810307 RepID=UPI001A9621D5|nr:protein-glutamate O-methyltransferase CheR [Aridibaculum aurantiacum]
MDKETVDITLKDVEDVLELLNSVYGYDFRNYARASMYRRIVKFMSDVGISQVFDLKHRLVNDRTFFDYLLQRITVNVTEMFRDPTFYLSLRQNILPMLASYPVIKIWHPGCSSGEEVYSMAILLHEAGLLQRSRIYATDINPHNIQKAKDGLVPATYIKDYTSNYIKSGGTADFSSYYKSDNDHVVFNAELRKQLIFSQHNLVTDHVFNEFQLVCCRNVLIYFNKDLQNRVLNLFYDSLSPLGYLALGIKESVLFSDLKMKFANVDRSNKIYRRIM